MSVPRSEPTLFSRALGRFVGCALGCALLVYGTGTVAPALPLEAHWAFVLAYGAVTLEILALSWCAPRLSLLFSALGCVLPLLGLVALAQLPASAPNAALLTLALGTLATLLGAALGARIERPGQLVAVALVSAIADLWSVFDPSAPSARFAEQALARPEQLALFALPFPVLGTPLIPAVIGGGDVVFAALYVAAFRAHGLSVRRVLLALGAGFVVGLVGLLVTLEPLPLLPLLGAAVVVSEPAARSLSAREWRTVIGVSAALVLAIVLRLSR